MGKRLWILLCLIVLGGVFSWSEWKDSLELARIHEAALRLHERSQDILKESAPAAASAEQRSQPVEAARRLEEQGWSLVERGQLLRRHRMIWQGLSVVLIVAILSLGLQSFLVTEREVMGRRAAEAKLLVEQASLENRIRARTAELEKEVEVRSRAEERNRRQKQVLELLASDASIEKIFSELTASVAVQRRSWESAIHLVDAASNSLRLIASSQVSDWLEHYLKTIAVGFSDAPESAAWTSGEPRYIESMIQQHRPWSEFLASNGIRSAWSLPLRLSDGKTAGTLTVYSRLFGAPDENDRELLDSAVRLASLVVDVRRMHRELMANAYEDELTGVANRRAGEIRLEEAIVRARERDGSFAVLWIDLDRFKRINDLYGHTRGDEVLREVSKRIAMHAGVNGSVARMGGDEFLVLLESCQGEDHARETAGELAALIGEPMQLGSENATVGASIGITLYPRDGETPDELERHADAAMYQAKRRSLAWCVFSSAMRDEVDSALSIEEGLRIALVQDPEGATPSGMLEVYYQPIYRAGGELIALEALLRFRHPVLGAVSPVQFIPIAEETKLIVPLGRWVLRQVCRQTVTWRQQGFPQVRVGVNISAVQWGREDFVEDLRSVMEETGAYPKDLTLELTESAVMQNAARARKHMRELQEMDVRVSMDDFGTGYSSLSYLHQLPLDSLKIDRSFIARLGKADDSRAIIESVVSMAHLLGMATIAEGVETEAQRRILVEMGCDALQGFLFARPMPSADASDLMRDLSEERHTAVKGLIEMQKHVGSEVADRMPLYGGRAV
jgi:diguanylate cyclase (GGDEF)-like protein